MTTETATQERRGQSHQLIDELLELRTEMLTLYSTLGSARPFTMSDELLENIQDFCQALVDYTANAHFSIYRYITEGKERRGSVVQIADSTYPKIAKSTDIIIAFNDKYDNKQHCEESLNMLENDLSYIGEVLAERIEHEDALINTLRAGR